VISYSSDLLTFTSNSGKQYLGVSLVLLLLLQLHWLPVHWRIQYKLCLMMHHLHTGRSPSYLADVVEPVSKKSTRRLRSTDSSCYSTPCLRTKFGERAFSFSGLAEWNALPTDIHDEACTTSFKKKLKTFYFFTYCFGVLLTIVMHPRSYYSGRTINFLLIDSLID